MTAILANDWKKRCVGHHDEVAALVGAMVEKGPGHGPDFFTVDVRIFVWNGGSPSDIFTTIV